MAISELKCVIGIDEVGRGALAGPVVVAAAMIRGNLADIVPPSLGLGALKDSKKLSAKNREAWYAHFAVNSNISFAVARVYPRAIERMNISGAANLAAVRAYKKLANKIGGRNKASVFLDGGLYLANRKWQGANFAEAKTVIKADEKIPAVAVASIVAKVHRDRFMRKLAVRYPAYGLEIHKGYATKFHRDAIKRSGSCEVHRATFLRPSAF